MIELKKVIVGEGYQLEVILSDGRTVVVDFSKRLNTVRFGRFMDKEFFRKVVIDGEMLRWEGEVEVSLNEVMTFIEGGYR